MTFPRARLAVAVVLFLAWLGYLLCLVLLSRHEVVLSRPQFLVADLCVLAQVHDDGAGAPDGEVEILGVFWSNRPADQKLKGEKITIANLGEAQGQGYIGPGKYILPLDQVNLPTGPSFTVRPVPSSPGYVPAFVHIRVAAPGPDPQRFARLAHEYLGKDEQETLALIEPLAQPGAAGPPLSLARNVPRTKALEFIRVLDEGEAANQKGAAEIGLVANDVRIYPLMDETQKQLDAMIEARKE